MLKPFKFYGYPEWVEHSLRRESRVQEKKLFCPFCYAGVVIWLNCRCYVVTFHVQNVNKLVSENPRPTETYEPVTLLIFFTMADILTLVFKSFITRGSKQFNVLPSSTCSTLVIGDKNISRSLLLFAAVKAASEMGMKVLFLTQTQIKSLPASLQHCMSSLSPDNLKVLQMSSYITSCIVSSVRYLILLNKQPWPITKHKNSLV